MFLSFEWPLKSFANQHTYQFKGARILIKKETRIKDLVNTTPMHMQNMHTHLSSFHLAHEHTFK
jgi:hypothetical protein